MASFNTEYGVIVGVINEEFDQDGNIKECMVTEYNQLKTDYGYLVPKYGESSLRSKFVKSLSFYTSGKLKSIYLEEPTQVITSIGILPAELITFYENGGIHRLFPLNGRISGYWSEEEEYNLASEISLTIQSKNICSKFMSIQFYDSQAIKSITLWRKNEIQLTSLYGMIKTNIGFSLYEDGRLKSIEPKYPMDIPTPIGRLKAYDTTKLGIHADQNSLCFYENQQIKSLKSVTDVIEVTSETGYVSQYTPFFVRNLLNPEEFSIEPITMTFEENTVRIKDYNQGEGIFSLENSSFNIKKLQEVITDLTYACGDCASCDKCRIH